MPVTVLRKPKVFTRMENLPSRVRAGIAVKGEAAKYALVWEWGTVRFAAPGPKTTWGSNPDDGQTKIFTKTAPSGYVRIHKQQFYDMAKLALREAPVQTLLNGSFAVALQENLDRAATEAAQIMANDAPIDKGLLRASIYAISGPEMQQLLQASYRPLLIGAPDGEIGS
jgi:hypothetical protein